MIDDVTSGSDEWTTRLSEKLVGRGWGREAVKIAWVNQQVACWRECQPNKFVVMLRPNATCSRRDGSGWPRGRGLTTGDTRPVFDRLRYGDEQLTQTEWRCQRMRQTENRSK